MDTKKTTRAGRALSRGKAPTSRHQIELSIVSDTAIRELLSSYWEQARLACEARAYVGSVALSGGVLEGLLTWALHTQHEKARTAYRERYGEKLKKRGLTEPPPIEEWALSELIEVNMSLGLLSDRAKKTAHAVQEFRNYIHPYKARHSSWVADRSLALIALGLVEKFAESLRKRLDDAPDSQLKAR